MKSPIVDHIELWDIERLVIYAGNPRIHSDKQIKQLAASIKRSQFFSPVAVDRFGVIIAGEARVTAAKLLGLMHIPVIVLDHLTEPQVRDLRLADNRIAENVKWDKQKLSAELQALLEVKIDLSTLGFDELELKELVADLEKRAGQCEQDAVPGLPAVPLTKPGDLWIMGDHRILCGDSTLQPILTEVLEGCPAALIYGDFPYNANYLGSPTAKTPTAPILNDNLGREFPEFLRASCSALLAVSGGALYLSMSSAELHALHDAFVGAGGHWSTFIIWVKNTFTLGRSPYQRHFEPILFGWKEGGPHYFCGARNLSDVWFIDKPRVNDVHPTMKPVELVERAILHSSQPGDLVLDPYSGSGTTAIACQKNGRRARLVELEPLYVDVALSRWQAFSGQQAVLASNGRSFEELRAERHLEAR